MLFKLFFSFFQLYLVFLVFTNGPSVGELGIAPRCLLQADLKRHLPSKCVNVGLMYRSSSPDTAVYFLQSLGKIYMNGFNPKVEKLNKKVEFLVSVGRPNLNSQVKWYHSTPWDVDNQLKYDEAVIEVSLSNESDAYLVGHTIEGRIFFPATTDYKYLVWKTFAKLRGTTFDQLSVVFENLTFQRATKKNGTKFSINILESTAEFEVIEGKSDPVSGYSRGSENISKEFLQLKNREVPKKPKFLPLDGPDAYKELKLRGYDYQGLFRGIKTVDNQGDWAKLNWDENWVNFLDTMLQFTILSQPNRGLYLPTRLQQATIDPMTLKDFVLNNVTVEPEGIPVSKYKNINLVKCHGVEIRGLKVSLAPRRTQTQTTKLEEYSFTPYFDDAKLINDPKEKALRVVTDLVIENTQALRLKVTEISSKIEASSEYKVHDIALGQPQLVNDVILMTLKSEATQAKTEDDKLGIKFVTKEVVEKLVPDSGCHLILIDNEKYLGQIEASLKEGAFILLQLPPGGKLTPILWSTFYNLVSHKISESKEFYLYKKKSAIPPKEFTKIEIDNNKYGWLDELKTLMGKAAESQSSESSLIYLISQNNSTSGIIGMINCLKQEPGGQQIRCIFSPQSAQNFDFTKPCPTLQKIIENDMLMNVFEGKFLGSYRHFPLSSVAGGDGEKVEVEHAYINTQMRGDLSSLKWIEGPLKYYKKEKSTQNTEELYSVHYAPLNFRDIMLATGKLPPDALPGNLAMQDCVLGLEFAGKNTKNQRVMGLVAARGLATTVLADPTFMWEVPAHWTMEEAATVPVCYATAYYALVVRGKMIPGNTVLIHSGSGGVGQAAISIALSMNCKVFTTVGSQDKKDLLKKLLPKMEENFVNSRDTSFEQHVLEHTGGRGVDLEINSLTEKKLQVSARCLVVHGRFPKIGKFDLSNNSPLGMSVFLKNITFHGILLLDSLFDQDSEEKCRVIQLVSEGIESGAVKPLPRSVFSDDEAEEAFKFMARSGKHVGKVLLKIRNDDETKPAPRTFFDPEKCYVLIGGLGGFGLELTGWLIERGANKLALVVVSRSGITPGYQDQDQSVLVETPKAEVTTLKNDTKLFENLCKIAPIGGIYNLAMFLKDRFIENQTFAAVCIPKINGTENLDVMSRKLCKELDHFVISSSSVSCGRGNAAQSNYGLANSAMERICVNRQKDGLHALAIQWGAIGDVRVVLDQMGGNDTVFGENFSWDSVRADLIVAILTIIFVRLMNRPRNNQRQRRRVVRGRVVRPRKTNQQTATEIIDKNVERPKTFLEKLDDLFREKPPKRKGRRDRPVHLFIYHCSPSIFVRLLDWILSATIDEGIYHVGVVVGLKYEYDYGRNGATRHMPGRAGPNNQYCKAHFVGYTRLMDPQVANILQAHVTNGWGPNTYNFFTRNCVHFAQSFAREVCPGAQIPTWLGIPGQFLLARDNQTVINHLNNNFNN